MLTAVNCDYDCYDHNFIYICFPAVHIIFLRDSKLSAELSITMINKRYKPQK